MAPSGSIPLSLACNFASSVDDLTFFNSLTRERTASIYKSCVMIRWAGIVPICVRTYHFIRLFLFYLFHNIS